MLALGLQRAIVWDGMNGNAYRRIKSIEQEVLEQDGKIIYTDDDEYWGNGFTYHNPQDKRIVVPKRVGIGDSINTGTWAGKLIMGGIVGILAAVLGAAMFMLVRAELTSPTLMVTPERQISIHYPMYSLVFNGADIEGIALVDQVPAGSKSSGEATSTFARGYFSLKGIGKARLFIFKNHPPYIRIKLEGETIYYNEKDPLQTKELFKQLQGLSGDGGQEQGGKHQGLRAKS